ncbi:hypothetical protein [Pseudacidovorax sp. RU35E]|uniref:hypothetical protein n=1 Tax=Pseudacidovorax sp. RU35E TaxID=1907403 RepID=UPI0009559DEA|nr:hypothetical protein [Pseudacidovorax sp. RU35E]SIR00889.1 hypothetical protein SAMN05880557_107109 [Pseudacidovorax sp. RU35E]
MSRYVPTGTYTGEDLARQSARPGAYDAMSIPSRMGDRRLSRAEMRAELAAPLPAMPLPSRAVTSVAVPEGATAAPIPLSPPPIPSPLPVAEQAPPPVATVPGQVFKQGRSTTNSKPEAGAQAAGAPRSLTPIKGRGITAYTPRHGSVPHVIVQHLRANGGCVTYSAAAAMTGANAGHLTAICKAALLGGALMRHRVGDNLVLALPGWTPPTETVAASPAAALSPMPDRVAQDRPPEAMTPHAAAIAASITTLNTSLAEAVRAYERAGQALAQLQADLQAHQEGAANG